VRPLLLATAASVVVQLPFMAIFQQLPPLTMPFVTGVAWTWALSLGAAVIFAFPLLLLVRLLRRPPKWLAMIWGTAAACAFAALFVPGMRVMAQSSPQAWGGLSLAGAAAGLLCASLVRRGATSK
jgi:hypothetical protein